MVYDSVHTYGKNKAIWIRGITSIHAIEVFMTTSQKMMIILYPVFIVLIAMTGYFMLKRALKQVDLICDQVENISYGKDLTKRLPLPKVRDELYELSHKFNQMFERLEESFEKEQQFTADVSHELRTPVTVIISQCEYLIEDPVLEEEEKEEAKETAAADKKVGVFLPSSADDPRWSADGETLQNTLEDDGYDAEIFWADEDLSLIHISEPTRPY